MKRVSVGLWRPRDVTVHAPRPTTWSVKTPGPPVDYDPANRPAGMFGGNSNWRGPVWFPINFLMIESLQKFHHYLGDDFRWSAPRLGPELTLRGGRGTVAQSVADLPA